MLLDEVDGEAFDGQKIAHALGGGVERVGERELGDGLANDREQRAAAVELGGERAAPLAGA